MLNEKLLKEFNARFAALQDEIVDLGVIWHDIFGADLSERDWQVCIDSNRKLDSELKAQIVIAAKGWADSCKACAEEDAAEQAQKRLANPYR